jgi:hypothetical protein
MAVALGKGNDNSTLTQTLGRGTGNNRGVLKANGHTGVQLLAPEGDLAAAIKTAKFQLETISNKEEGETIKQTMEDNVYSDDAHFIRHNER